MWRDEWKNLVDHWILTLLLLWKMAQGPFITMNIQCSFEQSHLSQHACSLTFMLLALSQQPPHYKSLMSLLVSFNFPMKVFYSLPYHTVLLTVSDEITAKTIKHSVNRRGRKHLVIGKLQWDFLSRSRGRFDKIHPQKTVLYFKWVEVQYSDKQKPLSCILEYKLL